MRASLIFTAETFVVPTHLVFNRNRLPLCQLKFVDIIGQNVVCTQTQKTVFIIRSLTSLSKVYKVQAVCEILTLEKRKNMKKRYINELLYGIFLYICWCIW